MKRNKVLAVFVCFFFIILFARCMPPVVPESEIKWIEENPGQQMSSHAVYGFRLMKPKLTLVQKEASRSVCLEYRYKIPRDPGESFKESKEFVKKKALIVCSDDWDKRALFDSIARSYGDVGYPHLCRMQLLYLQVYNVDKVMDISVFALDDWSDAYPQGSCLDDNFKFISGSPDAYIRNGYHMDRDVFNKAKEGFEKYSWNCFYDSFSSSYVALPVCGKLSEIDFSRYDLLGYGNNLGLLDPIEPSTHAKRQIAVEITYEDGIKDRLTGYYITPTES